MAHRKDGGQKLSSTHAEPGVVRHRLRRLGAAAAARFWRCKALSAMTRREWESLCDRCGMCCVHKLEDERTGRVHMTNVACRLLDVDTCLCRDYRQRNRIVPDCLKLTPDNLVKAAHWLPVTCAYRRLLEGKGLPAWHPLVTGDPHATERAGMSARDRLCRAADGDSAELDSEAVSGKALTRTNRWGDLPAGHIGGD